MIASLTNTPIQQRIHKFALLLFVAAIAYCFKLQYDLEHQIDVVSLGYRIIAQYSIASLAMLLAWWSAPASPKLNDYAWLILAAVVARLSLLWIDPYTSNDVLRYLFDGRIALEGLDPYRVAHDLPSLSALREQWMPPAEHAKYPTLYPPLSLFLFSLAASAGIEDSLLAWKLMTTGASLAVLWLGLLVLQHANRLKHFPLLALSPLLILEPGEGAHIDIFSALAVIGSVCCWQREHLKTVGVVLGIGALLKMLPILLLLPMVILLRAWRSRFTLVLSSLTTIALGYLVALLLGLRPVGSLGVFFEKWRSGSPFFHWLEPYVSGYSMLFLVAALLSISFIFIALNTWRNRSDDGYLAMQLMFIVPLLLSPVIFPWYLLPLMVLMPLRPSFFVLTWSLSLPLIYEVLGQFLCCQVWSTASWPIHFVGVGLIIAASADFYFFSKGRTRLSHKVVLA